MPWAGGEQHVQTKDVKEQVFKKVFSHFEKNGTISKKSCLNKIYNFLSCPTYKFQIKEDVPEIWYKHSDLFIVKCTLKK